MSEVHELLYKLLAQRKKIEQIEQEKQRAEANRHTAGLALEEIYGEVIKSMAVGVPFVLQDPDHSDKCFIITKVKHEGRIEESLNTVHTHYYTPKATR